MKKMRILAVLGLCTILLTACGSKKESGETTESKEKVEVTEKAKHKVVGVKSDKAYSFLLKNATGKEIKEVAVKDSGTGEYPQSMLVSGEKIATDEVIQFYYTPENSAAEVSYSVMVKFADDTQMELLLLPLQLVKQDSEVILGCDAAQNVLFLEYTNENGEKINTLELEVQGKLAKEAAIAKEAEVAAEPAAPAESVVETGGAAAAQTTQGETTQQQQPATQVQEPATNTNTQPSQSVEECLGDEVLFN